MPATDLELLIAGAREAGQIAMGHFRADPQVWDKGEAGPVTEADLAVDAHLRSLFCEARPDYGWLSEETEDDTDRLSKDRLFIVDPIDGTRAFVAGQDTWGHSIAVAENGQPTAAVVYLPAEDLIYAAALGQGSTCNGKRLAVTDRNELTGAHVLSNKTNMKPPFWREAPDVEITFRPALAYRMALVAEGAFDAMLTLRPTWEWDVAAGTLLISEAGGVARDQKGDTLRFNNPGAQVQGVIGANPAISDAILAGLESPPENLPEGS